MAFLHFPRAAQFAVQYTSLRRTLLLAGLFLPESE
jgi:hypothetical protein